MKFEAVSGCGTTVFDSASDCVLLVGRFGVQMTTVGNETQTLKETKSLDDEYTPGVFKVPV